MPSVKRSVDVEVSNDELIAELKQFAKQASTNGVFFLGADGNPSKDEIKVGDILQPKPEVYEQNGVAKDTLLLVTALVPQAGIFFTSFHNRDGQPTQGFFTPNHVLGRHGGTPHRALSKPRKRGSAR